MHFTINNDTINVLEATSGGPAERVGIKAGDRIIAVDGENVAGTGITNEEVFKLLRGERGSNVKLTVKRNNTPAPIDFEVTRGDISVTSIDADYIVADSIGYIRVNKFGRTTYDEFFQALFALRDAGAKDYIVDLRGNTGGLLETSVLMANEFLPRGQKIVETKGRRAQENSTVISDGYGAFKDSRITVLIDETSASSSEIFAGAIQDNDRGLVVGRRSFGKGLVQNQTILPDSSGIRLTIARYFTPSGRSIQKEYKEGGLDAYEADIVKRFTHGEFYSRDSIKLDESKIFLTSTGRKVYGGGGIMPDYIVPEDTTGLTSYYLQVSNSGLVRQYAYKVAQSYREVLKNTKSIAQLKKVLPRDNTLLEGFVEYAVANGVPARWYYIRKSRNLILSQLKAVIARDVLGYSAFIEMLNENDPAVAEALRLLEAGEAPVLILPPADAAEADATAKSKTSKAAAKSKSKS